MKNLILILLLPFFLFGCASTPQMIANDAKKDCLNFAPPKEKFSHYSSAQLSDLQMVDAIASDKDKTIAAEELEEKLQALLSPLLADWPSESAENGALLIQPRVVHLRIISGKTRMLAGLLAGQSSVSLELNLIDVKTGDIIANPKITKVTIAQGGEGVTDSNILDYIANISHQYLLANM